MDIKYKKKVKVYGVNKPEIEVHHLSFNIILKDSVIPTHVIRECLNNYIVNEINKEWDGVKKVFTFKEIIVSYYELNINLLNFIDINHTKKLKDVTSFRDDLTYFSEMMTPSFDEAFIKEFEVYREKHKYLLSKLSKGSYMGRNYEILNPKLIIFPYEANINNGISLNMRYFIECDLSPCDNKTWEVVEDLFLQFGYHITDTGSFDGLNTFEEL